MPTLFASLGVLAKILVQLEEYPSAYALMDRIMPMVLECEDAVLAAAGFGVLADACVGMAGCVGGTGEVKRKEELLHKALEFLDRGGLEWARVRDDRERAGVAAKKARVMDYLGGREVRDDAVKMYVQLRREGGAA